MSEELTLEAAEAERLGVSRDTLRQLRKKHLEEGPHWVLELRGIGYTAEGVARVRELLAAAAADPEAAPEASGEAQEGPEVVSVRITKILANSKRMLADFEGERVVIAVRDNKLFMEGMSVSVLRIRGSALWHYRGKMPKRRGRL